MFSAHISKLVYLEQLLAVKTSENGHMSGKTFQKVFQAQLPCSTFCLCYGNRCYNTWAISEDTIYNENESEGVDNANEQ